MSDRFSKRPGVHTVALAGGVLFACVPLTPAMGLIGVPDAPADVAAANAELPPVADYRSPVVIMAAAEEQRDILAAQEAKQRALELKQAERQAALLSVSGGGTGGTMTFPSTGGTTGGTAPNLGGSSTPKSAEVQSLIRKHFPADELGNAMAVSRCESGHTDSKGKVNSDGTIDWGVFQLNDGGTLQSALDAIGVSYSSTAEARQLALDTAINVRAAAQIFATQGWAPWVCAYRVGIVAGLYSSIPGPMDGKFDQWGQPTVSDPVINDVPGTDPDQPQQPEPQPSKSSEPKPTKTPKPTPTPSPSREQSQSPAPVPSPPSSPPASPGSAAPTDKQSASPNVG